VREPICNPHAADIAIHRRELLAKAAAVSVHLARRVLPQLLQPLQDARITAAELVEALSSLTANEAHKVC
jgi:hypothetical protein